MYSICNQLIRKLSLFFTSAFVSHSSVLNNHKTSSIRFSLPIYRDLYRSIIALLVFVVSVVNQSVQ